MGVAAAEGVIPLYDSDAWLNQVLQVLILTNGTK